MPKIPGCLLSLRVQQPSCLAHFAFVKFLDFSDIVFICSIYLFHLQLQQVRPVFKTFMGSIIVSLSPKIYKAHPSQKSDIESKTRRSLSLLARSTLMTLDSTRSRYSAFLGVFSVAFQRSVREQCSPSFSAYSTPADSSTLESIPTPTSR